MEIGGKGDSGKEGGITEQEDQMCEDRGALGIEVTMALKLVTKLGYGYFHLENDLRVDCII